MANNNLAQDFKSKSSGEFRNQPEVKTQGEGALKAASDIAQDLGLDAKVDDIRETVSNMNSRVRELARQSEVYLKDHPYRALATGAILGLVVGSFFRRNRG